MLSTLERVLALKAAPLFRDLPSELLVAIAETAEELAFRPADVLIEEGERGDSLFVVVEGRVAIRVAGAGTVAVRGPQSVIGEMAVITEHERSATCVAEDDVLALVVHRDAIWALMARYSELALAVVRILAERLDEAVDNLRRLGATSATAERGASPRGPSNAVGEATDAAAGAAPSTSDPDEGAGPGRDPDADEAHDARDPRGRDTAHDAGEGAPAVGTASERP